ncbi:MAG: oligosaccharide flippase family protein [Bacteroidales bacterium]|nr:oligosaccharide flippase family protein [Bacteroidales bacterium]
MGIIARQTIKGSIANYIGIVIGFATTFFVLTDCLSPSEIGLTRILVDAAMLFSSLAMLGTSSSIIRFYPYFKDERHRDHGFFGWACLLPMVGYLIFVLLFLLFKQGIINLYEERSPLFVRYFYYLLPLTFFALYTSVFEAGANVLMRIAIPKFVREVGIRLCNLVTYLLYGHGIISFDWFVLLFCSSYALAAIVNFIYLVSLCKISFRLDFKFLTPQLIKQIFSYTLLVTVVALTSNVQLFNSLFLGAQGGLALAGIYTIAFYIANVVSVPARSLMAISGPVISQSIKENNLKDLSQLVKNVSLHQLIAGSFIYFFILINLDALYSVIPHGAEYASGIGVVLILGINNIFGQTCSPINSVLSYSRLYAYSLPLSLLMSATAIILNIKLIPILGINGAATASLGATVIYYTSMLLIVGRKLHIQPFSWHHARLLAIIVLLFGLNVLWSWFITPTIGNVMWDAVIKTILLGAMALMMTYHTNVSKDLNRLIDKYIPLFCKN